MRKAYFILFGLVASFLSTFIFRGLDANKARPNTGQRLQNALFWATDRGEMYFAEAPNSQFAISQTRIAERTFVQTNGDGTYTATVPVPAGYTVTEILVGSTVVWNGTSASLVVGDADSANGYIPATDLKVSPAADLTGAWGLNLDDVNGAYQRGKYYAAAGAITATVAQVGTGTAGRTRLLVVMTRGARVVSAATKA